MSAATMRLVKHEIGIGTDPDFDAFARKFVAMIRVAKVAKAVYMSRGKHHLHKLRVALDHLGI